MQNQAATNEKKMRILVAEDNEVNQKVIRTILERNGYQFEIAQDGRQALERYIIDEFDLILMDCQMPRMDGLQAATEIRNSETELNRSRCPIVALTANTMSGDKERCLKAGMDDFLAKPFRSQDLMEKINQWSNRSEKEASK